MDNTAYYRCDFIYFRFIRKDGIEYCYKEIVTGDPENSAPEKNINYVKDNFRFISGNIYRRDWSGAFDLEAIIETTPPNNWPTIKYILKSQE